MFVCECFSFFFPEVYGLYLNKTVGWEQSILRWCVFVCACACNSMFVRASSDDESEDVQAFTEAVFFFFLHKCSRKDYGKSCIHDGGD